MGGNLSGLQGFFRRGGVRAATCLTAEEQNYVMAKLAAMENENKLDALIEYGENACWHVFIYSDGLPPK